MSYNGMQDKKTELYNTVSYHKIDVFFVMEANITTENLQKYALKGYVLHNLPKYRQVASGILVRINNSLCAQFQIVKEMGNTDDKAEIVKTEIWKNNSKFSIYAV